MKLKDRLLIVKRALILAAMPKLKQVSFLWNEGDTVTTHTIYDDEVDPKNLMFLYFSHIAGKSDDFDSLTRRTCFLLNKIAVTYALHNKIEYGALIIKRCYNYSIFLWR